jgi:crotonobetainyl-CoA:carnitine CoA-transferase CaiB-like acyl-CoA transferase
MLGDIKILSFTHYLQGPSAAQTLADMGADVVKVEPPKGAYERGWSGCNAYKNGVSVFFLIANRNQRAIALDLKSEEGKEAIYRLVEKYDVILENFRPGVMEKLGLGYEALKQKNPKIIYCSCSGYGSTGPKVKKPGQDLLAQSVSGLAAITGNGSTQPSPVGTAVVDIHGSLLAAFGILSAVHDRAKTGKGHYVEVSLLGAAMDLQIESLGYYMNGGQFTSRPTTGLSTRLHQSPYGVYRTADGYITLSLVPVTKLRELCTPGVFDAYVEKDQMDKRLEFDKIVCAEILKKTTAEWTKIFEEKEIWYAPVNDYPELLKDEQVIYNKSILTMNHPVAGEVKVVGHANKYDGKGIEIRKLPPGLGEHTSELLHECGYSKEEIKNLADSGKIVAI